MRARNVLFAAAIALVFCTPVLSEWEVRTWEVGEGTEGVLVEDHRVPLVTVTLEFPVGTWSPWAQKNGAEEAFRIQFYDSGGELRSRADRLAVDLTAYMRDRSSVVQLSCAREDLEEALDLVREMLGNRDFERARLKQWNRAMSLNRTASEKSPHYRLTREARFLLFPQGDPRRLDYDEPLPISTDVDALVAARDTVIGLPGRIVAFAGDLTMEEARGLAGELLPPVLEEVPSGLEPVYSTAGETGPDHDRTVSMPRLTQVYLHLMRDSLVRSEDDFPAYMIANHVLGGHFYSRLYTALRHQGGETYGARSYSMNTEVVDVYTLTTYTHTANAGVAEEKLRRALREFHEKGITEEEREAAAGFITGRRPFSRQSPQQVLDRYLWERRNGHPKGFGDALVERAAETPLETINEFIRRYYDPSRFTLIRVAPE